MSLGQVHIVGPFKMYKIHGDVDYFVFLSI